LLREHKTHNLAELDIVNEELNMGRIWRELGRPVWFVLKEIVLRYHLYVRVFRIDSDRPAKCYSYRSVP